MSKKANPTVVGGFALGAIALAVLAIVLLGGNSLFRHRPKAVAFFQGNIQGLMVGAPVTLDGVAIGTVTDIKIEVTPDLVPLIPVYMEFDAERLHFRDVATVGAENEPILKAAIARGLHARLASQSLVTGQLLVDLSFDKNETARVVGADPTTVEIPTALSDMEKLKTALSNIPLNDIAASLLRTLNDIDTVVKSPQISALLTSLTDTSKSINDLASTTCNELPPLIANVNQTVKTASTALNAADATLNEMHGTFAIANRLLETERPRRGGCRPKSRPARGSIAGRYERSCRTELGPALRHRSDPSQSLGDNPLASQFQRRNRSAAECRHPRQVGGTWKIRSRALIDGVSAEAFRC